LNPNDNSCTTVDAPQSPTDVDVIPNDSERTPVQRFQSLFAGRTVAYGYSVENKAFTARRRVTSTEYTKHLSTNGRDDEWSLGLCPLRDDNTVRFGALDFDAPGLSDEEVRSLIAASELIRLPLTWTASRSGGLHAWIFLGFDADPGDVQRVLRHWCQQLGWHEKTNGEAKAKGDRFFEVFPKQVALGASDPGNWIRLPWPGGEHAERRRGVWLLDGAPSFAEWLGIAEGHRISPPDWQAILSSIPEQIGMSAPGTLGADMSIDSDRSVRWSSDDTDGDEPLEEVRQLLEKLSPDRADDYLDWVKVLMALHYEFSNTRHEAPVVALATQWAMQSARYNPGDVETKWQSFGKRTDTRSVTLHSLRRWAATDAIEQAVEELNESHAHVMTGGSGLLVIPEAGEPEFIDTRRWKEHLRNRRFRVGKRDRGLGEIWLEHPRRRSYASVTFDPNAAPYHDVPSRFGAKGQRDFNLWPGFECTPSTTGSCQRFLDHLRDIVASGDEDLYNWLVQYLAHIVQAPTRLAGTAVALQGTQGSGKSLVGEIMGAILGARLYTKVSKPEELTGRFNAHHYGRLLVQVEEAFWAGDKRAEGALKNMITSDTVRIERKFMDPIDFRNYTRLIITTNNDRSVPAGLGERRFAVLDVSGKRANDHEYFRELRSQMFEQGGCERLFHFLLHETDVDWTLIRRPPRTSALRDQQIASLPAPDRWLFEILNEGLLPGDDKGVGQTSKDTLFQSYSGALKARNRSFDAERSILGKLLKQRLNELVTTARPREGGGRVNYYQFAPLAECRARFAERLSVAPEWSPTMAWQSDDLPLSL